MELTRLVENMLKGKDRKQVDRQNLLRLQLLIKEKTEKGILLKKNSRLPSLQETERHSHEIFFGK